MSESDMQDEWGFLGDQKAIIIGGMVLQGLLWVLSVGGGRGRGLVRLQPLWSSEVPPFSHWTKSWESSMVSSLFSASPDKLGVHCLRKCLVPDSSLAS